MYTPSLIHMISKAASDWADSSMAGWLKDEDVKCSSNLPKHKRNTWISQSGIWRWTMLGLCEIGSRHKSHINMILRQVAFSFWQPIFWADRWVMFQWVWQEKRCQVAFSFLFFSARCAEERMDLFAESQ